MARRNKKHRSPRGSKKSKRAPIDMKSIRARKREVAALRRKAERSGKSTARLEAKMARAKATYDSARAAIRAAKKAPKALAREADRAERSLQRDVARMIKGEARVMRLMEQLKAKASE